MSSARQAGLRAQAPVAAGTTRAQSSVKPAKWMPFCQSVETLPIVFIHR